MGRFKYLGRLLDWSDCNWPEVLHSIRMARQVWGRLGGLIQRDGAEPTVSAKFYHAVVQVVILFQAETCVLTETMSQRIEGAHMSF